MGTAWRFLDLEYDDPYFNLSVEEAISTSVRERLTPDTIRFWRNLNAVVVGRLQSVKHELNLDACKKHRTSIVRRFTGGGAVYQDIGNLNFAISVRRDKKSLQIIPFYESVAAAVVRGLEYLAFRAEITQGNCLLINGKKISGLAGALKLGVQFCHGTLLVNTNLTVMSEVLRPRYTEVERPIVRSNITNVTTLGKELGREISIPEVKEALLKMFEETYHITLVHGELTEHEKQLAWKLYTRKYSTYEWNFKSPRFEDI